jgi:hypothetical protein
MMISTTPCMANVLLGTLRLASRLGSDQGATSAATILALRNLAKEDTVVMDVNLRPPWYDPASVLALSRGDDNSSQLALVKLNEEELPIVEKWCGLGGFCYCPVGGWTEIEDDGIG